MVALQVGAVLFMTLVLPVDRLEQWLGTTQLPPGLIKTETLVLGVPALAALCRRWITTCLMDSGGGVIYENIHIVVGSAKDAIRPRWRGKRRPNVVVVIELSYPIQKNIGPSSSPSYPLSFPLESSGFRLKPGVRTYKVVLPPRSERDRRILREDKNAWAGVPVGVAKRRPPPERLGPSPRSNTADELALVRSAGDGENVQAERLVTKHNWLPAPLVSEAGLLQTPLQDR